MPRRDLLVGWLVLIPAILAAGCDRPRAGSNFSPLTGVVEALQLDVGEVTVRTVPTRSGESERSVICVFAGDAETYVNDRYVDESELRIGDVIELLGTPETQSGVARLNVAVAYVTREEPPAPTPLAADPPGASNSEPTGAAGRRR